MRGDRTGAATTTAAVCARSAAAASMARTAPTRAPREMATRQRQPGSWHRAARQAQPARNCPNLSLRRLPLPPGAGALEPARPRRHQQGHARGGCRDRPEGDVPPRTRQAAGSAQPDAGRVGGQVEHLYSDRECRARDLRHGRRRAPDRRGSRANGSGRSDRARPNRPARRSSWRRRTRSSAACSTRWSKARNCSANPSASNPSGESRCRQGGREYRLPHR